MYLLAIGFYRVMKQFDSIADYFLGKKKRKRYTILGVSLPL